MAKRRSVALCRIALCYFYPSFRVPDALLTSKMGFLESTRLPECFRLSLIRGIRFERLILTEREYHTEMELHCILSLVSQRRDNGWEVDSFIVFHT